MEKVLGSCTIENGRINYPYTSREKDKINKDIFHQCFICSRYYFCGVCSKPEKGDIPAMCSGLRLFNMYDSSFTCSSRCHNIYMNE